MDRRPDRELQALAEVGRTHIERFAAVAGTLLFLLTLLTASAAQLWLAEPSNRGLPTPETGELLRSAAGASGPRDAGRRVLGAIDRFETALEERSELTAFLRPQLQELLTRLGGVGNERVYLGQPGWLFYRPDVDYVTGRGFLDRIAQREARRGGDAWTEPRQPDPLPALVDLARQLEAQGIGLVLLVAPSKAAVHPEALSGGSRTDRGARNRSFGTFADRLAAEGVSLVDPTPVLAAQEGDQYLRTDTHWLPDAVALVAGRLARRLEELFDLGPPDPIYTTRRVLVENRGDLAVMLGLPAGNRFFPAESVEADRVVTFSGRPWAADPEAVILLLGDSFTNIYSQPDLGWGGGAGLAEQLSLALGRPVDRLARNQGGDLEIRQALATELAAGRNRLRGKKVVIYQIAARELAGGDWQPVPLP